jgi:2-phosphoglycerate kinase
MIYLIGGPPRCGKTTIAQKLSKKLSIPWVSSDVLESIVIAHTPTEKLPQLFPKTVMRKKTKKTGNDGMYTQFTPKQITQAYIKQAKATWEAIRVLMESELKDGHSYIVEGYQIHPAFVKELQKKFGSQNVKSIFLVRYDIDKIVSGGKKYKAINDWFTGKTHREETYPKIAAMVQQHSGYFEAQAKKYGMKVIDMDSDFKGKLNEAIRVLIK